MTDAVTFRGGRIFDGTRLLSKHTLRFETGHAPAIRPQNDTRSTGRDIDLDGDIVFPGFVDLQVNGGDGLLLNDDPSVATFQRIAKAHRKLGVTTLLPTLITDSKEKTRATIAAAIEATQEVPGVAGLHLEGPHLSIAKKGAHDARNIRPMEKEDLAALLQAVKQLPVLKVTLAPESVTLEQVEALVEGGVLVSLGHTDADFDTCLRYFAAGVRCVTHLFNAMSQLGSRAPGLVGAALASGDVSAGLIADGVHVHPETIRAAWKAKSPPGEIFLVSDAMAVAGTAATEFRLGGRVINRSGGVLTLADGTLAGADLDLLTAVRTMTDRVGVDLGTALQAATRVPAELIGRSYGFERLSDVVRIKADLCGLNYGADES